MCSSCLSLWQQRRAGDDQRLLRNAGAAHPAHLLQAVYEGVVFSHMTHLNRMLERFTQVTSLRVTGGPTHSDVWMQMLADVSGLAIELPQVEETAVPARRWPHSSVRASMPISTPRSVPCDMTSG
jgi:sugar (pentulose or hexulose) kinase